MADYKRYALAAGTLGIIVLTGQVMEMSSQSEEARITELQALPLPVELSQIELTAAETELIGSTTSQPAAPQKTPVETAETCDIELSLTPQAGAMAAFDLAAPCAPNERVTIHHNGLMFTEATNALGELHLTVPVLSENAVFIASFAGGQSAVATAQVADLQAYHRAAVQMEGDAGASLYVAEKGTASAGSIIRLGNAALEVPLTAQVYSIAFAELGPLAAVSLGVDIEITAANCGKDIEAQTLQLMRGGDITVHDLDLSMPDCEATGDFLMLKNVLNNLKVAVN